MRIPGVTRRSLGLLGSSAASIAVVGLGITQQPRSLESERPEAALRSLAANRPCEPGAGTLCLHGGRYELQADWWTGDGNSGAAEVVPQATRDSGLFRFFDADNWEVLIKVLDGCAVNGHHWVYGASTTNLGYEIRVRDTATGDIKAYRNEPGRPAPAITDDKAFPDSCDVRPLPELVSPGSIAVEPRVWEGDVSYDSLGWFPHEADFDGDGDDDVLLTPGDAAQEDDPSQTSAGVILINNGDFTFEVAAGDRPRGVHQREVLMADFNGDGRNDFFIADHGYDYPPFPGWHNQLLLWTADGYLDATDRLPADPTGFTHNAAVGDIDGDGDVDILVANNGGDWIEGPYFLMNDGSANFVADTSGLPKSLKEEWVLYPWAVQLADLDGDGHPDLIAGARGLEEREQVGDESFVYWGSAGGRYSDEEVTVLPTPGFFDAYGGGQVVSTAVSDINRDGRPDIALGGYDKEPPRWRGLQLLVNHGGRVFADETPRRLGASAWAAGEGWHVEYRFLDFNGDNTLDIVPQGYAPEGANVIAWLNDGTGHYAALKTTEFNEVEALRSFALGRAVRVGDNFKFLGFWGDGTSLTANAAVVVEGAVIRRRD